ncbi:MAG: response regulator transcription factor [Acidimicrobiales bacterium]
MPFFATILESADDIEVVGEAENGAESLAIAATTHPDVVLMDIRMPIMDGLEATRRISSDPGLSRTRIVILTTFHLDDYVHEALRAGASGFLLKDTLPADLMQAVRIVAGGEALLAPNITRRLIEEFVTLPEALLAKPQPLAQLTDRENEVLAHIAAGSSNAEIAERLFISQATIKTHVSRLLTKLDARDRAQLVMIAYETGAVQRGIAP